MVENAPQVLVVDDERFFREAVSEALAGAGIGCDAASDPMAALTDFVASKHPVVVLDLGLPEPGGIEVLKRLLANDPTVSVIVLAAQTEQDAVLEALRLGAMDYLAKPLHDEELVLVVRRALRGHEAGARWATLRDRLCALDARAAELSAGASGCIPGDRLRALAGPVAEAVSLVLGAEKTSLMLMGDDGSLAVAAAVGHEIEPEEMDPVAPGEAVAGLVVSEDRSFVVGDLSGEERLAGRSRSDRYTSNSLVVTPIAAGGPPFGVLCATDRADGSAFGAEDLALLRLLALQVGQLLGAEFGGAGDLELARRVCDAISTEVEPDRVIAAALRAVAQALPAAPVALHLMDGNAGVLRIEGQFEGTGPLDREGLGRDGGLTGLVLQTGHLVATNHPDKDPRFDPEVDTPADGSIRPLICVPIQLRGKTLGVVRAFTMSDASARSAEVLSAAMSAAVRNVLLYRSLLESIDEVARVRRSHRGQR